MLPRLRGEYQRLYYGGIIWERRGTARLDRGGVGGAHVVFPWLRKAMDHYEKAEAIRPPGNDDAILRWNTCAGSRLAPAAAGLGSGFRAGTGRLTSVLSGRPMSPAIAPDLRDLLALHLLPGLGPVRTAALIERFGSAGAALRAGAAQLREVPHIGPKLTEDLSRAKGSVDVDVDAELALIARHGVHLRALGTPEYPADLAQISDPPHLLYVRGTIVPADAKAVALVGSRKFTGYGRRVVERLATDLARAGYAIVSGLARGIDGIAHRAALKAGGRTLAVMAGGLSRIYPPEHAGLADEVAAAGALVSEAPMSQDPLAGMFPAAQPHHQWFVARGGHHRGGGEERGAHHRLTRRRAGPDRLRRTGAGR